MMKIEENRIIKNSGRIDKNESVIQLLSVVYYRTSDMGKLLFHRYHQLDSRKQNSNWMAACIKYGLNKNELDLATSHVRFSCKILLYIYAIVSYCMTSVWNFKFSKHIQRHEIKMCDAAEQNEGQERFLINISAVNAYPVFDCIF